MSSLEKDFWNAEKATAKRKLFKIQCVAYKGGKCQHCGYDRCPDALTFHHEDPAHKDFEISKVSISKMAFEKSKSELDKCILLCMNCHIEEHYRMRAEAKMEVMELFEDVL